jgi:hypothetical protein
MCVFVCLCVCVCMCVNLESSVGLRHDTPVEA